MVSLLRIFVAKLQGLFSKRQADCDFDDEVRTHLRLLTERFIRQGMSAGEAASAARRQFGNTSLLQDRNREMRTLLLLETLWRDVRYGARQLRKSPGFTLTAVLTLALGIGANTAIFSVIDGVLLKSLPYPEPERIVRIFVSSAAYPKFPLNPFDFQDFRSRNKSFDSFAAFTREDVQLSGSGEAERLSAFRITSGYFRVLGLKPEIGSEFDEKAEIPGNGLQVILSDRLWRTRFGAAPDILGRKITLNAQLFTVVGVMPPGTAHPGNEFHSLPYGDSVDIWWAFSFAGDPSQRGSHYMEGIGRLRKGVQPKLAQGEMNALMVQLAREHPADAGWQVLVIPLYREIVGSSQRMLLVLLGAVGMVLLIACANVANLMMARATTRKREIAVRLALGASRSRLIRQLLTESLLIAFLGGGLGTAMAVGGIKALVSLLPADFPRAHDIHVSAPVFAFTILVSVATGILFGLAPALQASRTDPRQGMHEGARTSTGGGRQRRLRNALVVSEVGLACVLLIGAGLMLRSFLNLLHLDPGFRQEHVLTATLLLPRAEYKTSVAIGRFYDDLVTHISSLPGVQSAGAETALPWTGYDGNADFSIEGKTPQPHETFHARFHTATPDYFRALGIPLVRGRFFTKADNQDAPNVLIINQAMAERYWPHEDALGKRITFRSTPKDKDWLTVVGVTGNVKDRPSSAGAEPAFWWPHLQRSTPDMSLVVRADFNSEMLADAIRQEVKRLDPALAVSGVRLMNQIVEGSVATPRFAFVLMGLFAALAVLLAAIGTYGVISYSVSQRVPEFGLRIALGAQRNDVLHMVLFQATKLALAGTALGLIFALTLAQVLRGLIYQVSPVDPLTFTAVGLTVIAMAMLAGYIPAQRATRTDPAIAMRAE